MKFIQFIFDLLHLIHVILIECDTTIFLSLNHEMFLGPQRLHRLVAGGGPIIHDEHCRFIWGGTILHEGLTIRGLTTAASLWMVSAIGLAAGSGMYFLSSVATIITMITLVTFHTWEKRFAANSRSDRQFIRIITTNRSGAITDVTGYLSLNGVQVKSLNVKRDKEKNRLVLEVFLKLGKTAPDGGDLVRGLQGIEGVVGVENMR